MININFVVQIVQEAKVSCSIKHSFRCPVMILVVVNSTPVKVQTSAGDRGWPVSNVMSDLGRGWITSEAVRVTLRPESASMVGPASNARADLYWAPARPRVPTTANVCVRTLNTSVSGRSSEGGGPETGMRTLLTS